MERPAVEERNREATERLRALGARLSDLDLATEIDPPWTAAGLFAHLAFWDRFALVRWEAAALRGDRIPVSLDDHALDLVNDAALPQWNAVQPRAAVDECLDAASAFDGFAAGVDPSIADEVVADGRERLLDRSIHRAEHLRTLEAAFPAG
jgi:hypothetical protein